MMKNIFATGFLKSKICEIFGKHAWAGPPQDVHGCSQRGRVTFTIVIIAVVAITGEMMMAMMRGSGIEASALQWGPQKALRSV